MEKMTGQFVTSRAGHDKGTLYMVLAEDEKYVYLSEGRLKSPEKPKKKSRKHVQPINAGNPGLQARLAAGEKIRPEEIRYAIKQYMLTSKNSCQFKTYNEYETDQAKEG
ncbi:MAG: hypothetical protein NC432_01175 [Roseburia sp.]|nr:hypothetical protein [Roseburia sp.]MCM1097602.1 hypothetical protein [Ruminococcus flavefaciens]